MRIKIGIGALFLLLLFVFWAFVYPNHILFVERTSLFLYTSHFWKEFALQPGGWSAYCGNFLAQFYITRWAGALIQTLLAFALIVFSTRILQKTGVLKSGFIWIGLILAMLLTAMQFDNRFTPGDSLALITPFALTLLYMNLPHVFARRLLFALATVPVFLFSGAAATICLYAMCILYEIFFAKDAWKNRTPAWLVAVIFLPFVWKTIYLTTDDGLFDILSFSLIDDIKYVPKIFLSLMPLCLLTTGIICRSRLTVKVYGELFLILVWIGCGYYLFSKSFNQLEEQKFGMNYAIGQKDWDRVLKISKQVKKPDRQTAHLTNLALAMKGELPQKMFRYSQTDEHGLLLLRKTEFNLRYGADFYYHIDILNEAIRWIFDANIIYGKGMDYHTLTHLAVWNKEAGYATTAEKYFDILEETLMYRSWAKRQRIAPSPERKESSVEPVEFYIGEREIFPDMVFHYNNNPNNPLTLDYLLCYLLLKQDPEKFLNVFNACYQPSHKELPQAYQEALLYIADMGKIDIENYPISQVNMLRYQSFCYAVSKGNEADIKKKFSDTWWYYSCKISK